MSAISTPSGYDQKSDYGNGFELYSPALLIACFAVTSIYQVCKYEDKPPSGLPKRSLRLLLLFSFATTVSFVAQAVQYPSHPLSLSESSFIHNLWQILLWTTLSLTLANTSSPNLWVYLPTWSLSFLVEATVAISDTNLPRKLGLVGTIWTISQAVTTMLHLSLISCGLLLNRKDSDIISSEESQSLLGKSNDSSQNSTYGSLHNAGSTCEDISSLDSDEGEDEDDDKELKEARKQKLQHNGGWLGYLKSFKTFLPFILPFSNARMRLQMSAILINILLQRVLNVLYPFQLSIVLDRLATEGQLPWKNFFLWALFLCLASNTTGLGAMTDVLLQRVMSWSRRELNMAAFDKVMSLSMNFHDQKDSGEIIKAVEQAGSLTDLLRDFILDLGPGVLEVIVALWYVGYLFDVYATIMMVAVGVGFVFASIFMAKFMTKSRREVSNKDREESKILFESISNWATVSYFGRKQYEASRLFRAAEAARVAGIRNNDIFTCLLALQEPREQLGLVSISLLAAYRIAMGTTTVGKFIALHSYWGTVMMPLYILGNSYRYLSSNLIDAERLLQIFETPVAVKDRRAEISLTVNKGEVEFSNVSFAYEGRTATIDGFSFKAQPGQTVALVGATGSGKSTLLKLLMRFYDIVDGSIKIDGQDIRDVSIDSLRESFGFVPQETVLFNTTILENVRYGRLGATDEEVYAACKEACIHDKILTFPGGYRAKVGERGVKLSGGERQRIAVARVMLRNPKIVLLDEATSAMDSLTESKVQSALSRLMKGQTAFVIAHRLSTVADADVILVMEDGKVIEKGTHTELLQRGGRYIDLWKKQEMVVEEEKIPDNSQS